MKRAHRRGVRAKWVAAVHDSTERILKLCPLFRRLIVEACSSTRFDRANIETFIREDWQFCVTIAAVHDSTERILKRRQRMYSHRRQCRSSTRFDRANIETSAYRIGSTNGVLSSSTRFDRANIETALCFQLPDHCTICSSTRFDRANIETAWIAGALPVRMVAAVHDSTERILKHQQWKLFVFYKCCSSTRFDRANIETPLDLIKLTLRNPCSSTRFDRANIETCLFCR